MRPDRRDRVRELLLDLVKGALVVEKEAPEHGTRFLQGKRFGGVRARVGQLK
jgi:hypothetical protein